MRENRLFHLHDGRELRFRVGMEGGDIDKIVKGTASSGKGCAEVRKGKLNLAGKIGLRRAIFPAADLGKQLRDGSSWFLLAM